MINNRRIGCAGYSTMVDALAFLVLVSVAALVLAPVLFSPDDGALPAEQEQMARAALLGLADARVEEFNYTMVPEFAEDYVHRMGGNLGTSELLQALLDALFGHHLRHRTYADLLCDFAACQFYLGIGEVAGLNPLAGSYRAKLEAALGSYFSGVLGPGWGWRVQVAWEPFAGVPVGGYAAFGFPGPRAAWCAGLDASMPCGAALDPEEVRDVLAPYAENASGDPGEEAVRCQVHAAFEALADAALNSTLVPHMRGFFEWAQGFSGASRVLRLNESLLSGETVDLLLGYEVSAWVDDRGGNLTLDLDGLRRLLRELVVGCNRDYLDDLSATLSSSIRNEGLTSDEVLWRLCDGLGDRFPVSRARLTLQLWEVA